MQDGQAYEELVVRPTARPMISAIRARKMATITIKKVLRRRPRYRLCGGRRLSKLAERVLLRDWLGLAEAWFPASSHSGSCSSLFCIADYCYLTNM